MRTDLTLHADGIIHVVELGVDADEEKLGIVEIIAIHWKTAATVKMVDASGYIVVSHYINNDPDIARAKARRIARERLFNKRPRAPIAAE